MISEVDIRDWQAAVREGYDKYMAEHAHEQPYGLDVWTAATHWAFEFMWARQEKAKSAWRKRQINSEEYND